MRKILNLLIFILILLPFFINDTHSNNKETFFVVTAYYSPLPNQEYYLTGDYELEKRLNGEGIRGASGKKVLSGMLAAPKKYKFGTKIKLEGLGIGEVLDRGGAIVRAGKRGYSYDRIDIWVGYGDEGLRRALYWGKRTIKGEIVSNDTKLSLNYYNISSPSWAIKGLKKVSNLFNSKLNKNSNISFIKKIQLVLKDLNFHKGEINGNYKNTVDSIYDYQLSKGIVSSVYTPGAGNYGPITRKTMEKSYNDYLKNKKDLLIKKKLIEEKKKKEELKKIELIKKSEKEAKNILVNIGSPIYGEISHGVRELQITLRKLGYFEYRDTAIYGNLTSDSIISYQLDKKIINSITDLGAGIIGPKTKKSLINDLKSKYFNELTLLNNKI